MVCCEAAEWAARGSRNGPAGQPQAPGTALLGDHEKAGGVMRDSGTAQDMGTLGKSSFDPRGGPDPQVENHCTKARGVCTH